MKKTTSGFTIIELLVVMIVIGILAAIVIVTYSGAQGRARDATRQSDTASLIKALETYYDDNGSYPVPASNWYYTKDATWTTFKTALANNITTMPGDPKNTGDPTVAGMFGYAYYSSSTGNNCGRVAGQWYLLVWRFEGNPQTKFTDGSCSGTNYGDTLYSGNGISYYESVK